ncbi:hypothetical protein [Streptomyces genisteinicus]|uniref:Uncharacterized protein n=1 Tax=Streptomyces genisteinicus TaxID=2768068 RepID=A0A7H0I589_9ACTN|nr:hypothetical protein [Streptomyces genisteinicus]QNP67955.1 hypothetical protein IAG43_33865 [Streptomyces genisteinicus]
MIRAGRQHLVRTLADLAAQQGVRLQSYLNSGPHKQAGFPAPITEGRTRLYDGEQVDAYLAGRPVPALPDVDDDQDLLDRREAAAAWGVSPRTWDSYKRNPQLEAHRVEIGGVEHWPRGIVRDVNAARPGKSAATGRPKDTGDQVPRDLILERTAPLLNADPAVSAAAVTDTLGIHTHTAQNALTALRADRMATVMERDHVTAEQAANALGYPTSQTRRATVRAATVLRGRAAAPYLADIAQALHAQGWTSTPEPPAVQHSGEVCVAALVLDEPTAPAPALVWDERHGWRTAVSRRHPIGPGGAWPLPGDGIRHLATGTTPTSADLITALAT